MKTVKLSCPRCQAENHYAVADLQAANGRVQCSQCRHAFTVTRKPKAQSAPAAQAEILQEDVIHAKMPLREKLARLKQQSAALAAQQAGQDADEPLHTQKKPLAAQTQKSCCSKTFAKTPAQPTAAAETILIFRETNTARYHNRLCFSLPISTRKAI